MKHFFLVMLFGLIYVASTKAQDARYVGTWKWHYDSPYDDEIEGPHSQDKYIKIDVEDGQFFVRLKLESKNYKGLPFQTRRDGENIEVYNDGSISFDEYLSKKEFDKEDHLYWTIWTHYNVKYEGGRLKVSEKTMGVGCNNYGSIVKDERDKAYTQQKTYYNEKDNW